MPRGERWRWVGWALAAGAIYDLAFGVAILAFTRSAASILGLQVPGDPIYLYLCGVLLLLLGAIYVAASRDPERYAAVAPISSAGRTLGFALFAWASTGDRPPVFLALGVADLALGLSTFVVWRGAVSSD